MKIKGRFIVVGTQRSGSSAIVEAVGRHPDIVCGYEWTQRVPTWRKIAVGRRALNGDFSVLQAKHRDQLQNTRFDGKSVLGFKRLFRSSDKWIFHPRLAPALWADRLEGHIRWLSAEPDISVVHIVRQNNLDWLTSKALADASSRYVGQQYPDNLRVSITANEALRRVRTKRWIDERLASLRRTNSYFRANYEDFRRDNYRVTFDIVTFLGCPPERLPDLPLRHQRQSSGSGASLINAEEIRRALGPLAIST